MTPEARKQLEEMARAAANRMEADSSSFMVGAQAAWEIRDAEIAEYRKTFDWVGRKVAEAVKAERERCAEIASDAQWADWEDVRNAILNPKKESE